MDLKHVTEPKACRGWRRLPDHKQIETRVIKLLE
jgi:hypothetical protein